MEMPKDDIKITCVECKKGFRYTIGEQCYFLAKGLAQPKRCPECRAIRKEVLQLSKEMADSGQ